MQMEITIQPCYPSYIDRVAVRLNGGGGDCTDDWIRVQIYTGPSRTILAAAAGSIFPEGSTSLKMAPASFIAFPTSTFASAARALVLSRIAAIRSSNSRRVGAAMMRVARKSMSVMMLIDFIVCGEFYEWI